MNADRGKKAHPGSVPIKSFQIAASFPPKEEEMATIGIGIQRVDDLRRQTIGAYRPAGRPGTTFVPAAIWITTPHSALQEHAAMPSHYERRQRERQHRWQDRFR